LGPDLWALNGLDGSIWSSDNAGSWDETAVPERYAGRQLLSGADMQLSPDLHRVMEKMGRQLSVSFAMLMGRAEHDKQHIG